MSNNVSRGRNDLFVYLADLGINTHTIDHEPLFTVEQSRQLRGQIAGAHAKNLFIKCRKGKLYLLVCLEDADIDLKALPKIINCGRISFAKPDLLMAKLGVVPGAVTPFAVINDKDNEVEVILQQALIDHAKLNFHPLDNSATTTISKDDLLRFLIASNHEPRILTF